MYLTQFNSSAFLLKIMNWREENAATILDKEEGDVGREEKVMLRRIHLE